MPTSSEDLEESEARRLLLLTIDALLAIVTIEIHKEDRAREAARTAPPPPNSRGLARRQAARAVSEYWLAS